MRNKFFSPQWRKHTRKRKIRVLPKWNEPMSFWLLVPMLYQWAAGDSCAGASSLNSMWQTSCILLTFGQINFSRCVTHFISTNFPKCFCYSCMYDPTDNNDILKLKRIPRVSLTKTNVRYYWLSIFSALSQLCVSKFNRVSFLQSANSWTFL